MPCRGHSCLHLQIGSLLFSVEFIILTTHPRPRLLPSTLIIYPYWGMAKVGVKNRWAQQLLSLAFSQSLLINFKLDVRLHFMSWLSISRGCYLILPYCSLGHAFHTLSWSLQSISINFELDVGLHFMSWLSVGRGCYLILPYHSLGHTFHMLSQSLQSVSINFELDVRLHFMLWLSVGRGCYLISPYHSLGLTLFTHFHGLSNLSQSTSS
jgi:hypothetical protein